MTKDEALARCIGPHKSEEGDRHRALAYSRTTITAIKATLEKKGEIVACGACNGSGRMVRDPDIGTDQECFVCEGTLEAKDEPVAWYRNEDGIRIYYETKAWDDCIPLYTISPQRKPLTEKELNVLGVQWHFNLLESKDKADLFAFARAIEAAHGIKEKS